MTISGNIPFSKFNNWFSCFSQNNGYFVRNPIINHDSVYVVYSFKNSEDYSAFRIAFNRYNLIVKETYSSKFKNNLRKFKKIFRF